MTDLQRIRMWAMDHVLRALDPSVEATVEDMERMADRLVDWVMGDPGAAHEPIPNFREVHGILRATDEVPL